MSPRNLDHVSVSDYQNYYLNQIGHGSLPVYRGVAVQKGHGLGNILASAFRSAMPILKRGATYLGRKFINTGAKIASDVSSGVAIKEALKTRGKEMGKEAIKRAAEEVSKMTGNGRKKRRKTSPTVSSVRARKGRRSQPCQPDIFS